MIGTTDAHTRRHREEVERHPRFDVANSAQTNALDWHRMREQLGSGPGYVK